MNPRYFSRGLSRRILPLACLFLLAGTALIFAPGCKSPLEFRLTDGVPAPHKIVVFPLDDSGAAKSSGDYTFYGRIGAQDSGVIIARALAQKLSKTGFNVAPREELQRAIAVQRLSHKELGALNSARLCDLGRKLGADMIVTGRVVTYQTTWMTFLTKTKVSFQLRGVDPQREVELWTATAERKSLTRSELALLADLTTDIAQRLKSFFPIKQSANHETSAPSTTAP